MGITDYFLLGSFIALLFWGITSVYLQKKWHLLELFAGKKYAYIIHLTLIGFAVAQFLVGLIVNTVSNWGTFALPVLAVPILGYAVWLFAKSVKEHGFSAVTHAHIFKGHKPKKSRIAISYTCGLASFGLLTGHYAYFICALIVLPYFWLLQKLEKA